MPVVEGRSPVSSAVRDGLHKGDAQCAFENRTPRFASASMCGVCTSRYPRQPTQSFMSSTDRKSTFGFSVRPRVVEARAPPSHSRRVIICRTSYRRVLGRRGRRKGSDPVLPCHARVGQGSASCYFTHVVIS